ncbi:helix-turn-helix domain-containing protein [Massilia timonae]|uniref:helix-turn-helix domain-containing protein n=1 Tax=Massilia timonae TaxID=47229 RepID=UPI00289C2135|nr:helix-turn-helix transcriptional regulator [Massilia timonae]
MSQRALQTRSVISQRLRQARELAGLPQDRLGVLAGLEESSSSARISRYESGIHEPPVKFAEALARVLGVPLAFLYCSDDRLAEIILSYSAMSEAKRRKLAEVARDLSL